MVARGSDQATGMLKRSRDEGEREKEKVSDIEVTEKLPDKWKRSYLCHRREAKEIKEKLG